MIRSLPLAQQLILNRIIDWGDLIYARERNKAPKGKKMKIRVNTFGKLKKWCQMNIFINFLLQE